MIKTIHLAGLIILVLTGFIIWQNFVHTKPDSVWEAKIEALTAENDTLLSRHLSDSLSWGASRLRIDSLSAVIASIDTTKIHIKYVPIQKGLLVLDADATIQYLADRLSVPIGN